MLYGLMPISGTPFKMRQWASNCRALAAKMKDPAESRMWAEMADELDVEAENVEKAARDRHERIIAARNSGSSS